MKYRAIPYVFFFVLLLPAGGKLFAQSGHGKGIPNIHLGLNTNIPTALLHEILSQAAPQFGFVPSTFIRMYYTCNCILVEQIGPNHFRVVYGGIGIQIVIDATSTNGTRPRRSTQ